MTENVRASIAADQKKLAADPETAEIFLSERRASARRRPLPPTRARANPRSHSRPRRGRLLSRPRRARDRGGAEEGRRLDQPRRPRPLQLESPQAGGVPVPRRRGSDDRRAVVGARRWRRWQSSSNRSGRSESARRTRRGAHLLAEIEKRVYRDRNRYLGDPDFPGVRQDLFFSADRLRRIAATIDPSRATPRTRFPRSSRATARRRISPSPTPAETSCR